MNRLTINELARIYGHFLGVSWEVLPYSKFSKLTSCCKKMELEYRSKRNLYIQRIKLIHSAIKHIYN